MHRTSRRSLALALCLAGLFAVAAHAAPAPAPAKAAGGASSRPATATTKLSYLAGGSAYVDVGTADGLLPGDTLTILRDGGAIGVLKVAFASTKRAACDTVWTRAVLAIGDDVRYTPHPAPAPAVLTAADTTKHAVARRPAGSRARLRGRIGGHWLSVSTANGMFKEPGVDLRLDGYDQANGHVDLALDLRSRRSSRSFSGLPVEVDELARIYRASMTLRSRDSHHQLTVGRQISPTLASISLFDGVLMQTGNDRHSFGAFSGTQPDPVRYSFSPDILESGLFVEWHQAPAAVRRWQVSLGGVTSQQAGQANRDFLFTQANWVSRAVMTSFAQEVDYNRGWKRALGEPVLSPTSTFAMTRFAATRWLAFTSGYDNRRSVRLYRDRLTPETQFDDAYRQGTWVGSDLEILQRVRWSGELRGTAAADHSHAWSTNAEVNRLTHMHVALRGRMSRYQGSTVLSRLASGSIGLDPIPLSHLELSGGVRRTLVQPSTHEDSERWQSVDFDLSLGRRWYVNGGLERDYGGVAGETRQAQGGVSWRF